MSDHVFNVSGDKPELLERTIRLALSYSSNPNANGWYFSPAEGLVFCWGNPGKISLACTAYASFPAPVGSEFLAPMVGAWLKSDQAKKMEMPEADQGYPTGDGDNVRGWRVHLSRDFYALFAVRPSFIYYGK